MIFFLEKLLGGRMPSAFTYSSTRMALASVTTLAVVVLLGPYFIRKLNQWRIGQPIRMEECPKLGELHEAKMGTPTMGGVLILFGMLLSMFLWMDWSSSNTLILAVATVWLGSIGAYDDYLKLRHKNSKGLSGRRKFGLQMLFALLFGLYLIVPAFSEALHVGNWFAPNQAQSGGQWLSLSEYMHQIYLPFKKEAWLFVGAIPFLLLVLFVVVGASNSVNLTDGLDGLAGGCLVLVAGSFAIIAFLSNNTEIAGYLNILYIQGSGEVAVYLAAFAGGVLGFLWYNGYPAQLFMGDTGSLALGGIIGVCAVLLRRELLLAIIGGIFVAEALSVILQVASFRLFGRRIFRIAPLHHHFEYLGWPETKVVLRFWIIGLLLAICGLATLKFQ